MESIVQFIESLGGLHDAALLELFWCPATRSLEIEIDDIYSVFEGLPEYQGPTKARFVFSGVSKLNLGVDLVDSPYFYDWIFTKAGTTNCDLLFWPSGKITVECSRIECVKEST